MTSSVFHIFRNRRYFLEDYQGRPKERSFLSQNYVDYDIYKKLILNIINHASEKI